MTALTPEEIQARLKELSFRWKLNGEGKLEINLIFDNFLDAVNALNQIAVQAEEVNHHPDVAIHDYKNLDLTLFTHSDNGLTAKDFNLAKKIDEIVGELLRV